jgi:hypothetical protein
MCETAGGDKPEGFLHLRRLPEERPVMGNEDIAFPAASAFDRLHGARLCTEVLHYLDDRTGNDRLAYARVGTGDKKTFIHALSPR